MSSRRLPVLLSPRAEEDFGAILLYGVNTWGEDQADAYEDAIDRALDRLGRFPRMGRARDEIFPGCRSLPVEQHAIYYHADRRMVTIDRILHAKMDATGQVVRSESP